MLRDPELRRGLRNLAAIATVFALLALVWLWSARFDVPTLRAALGWAMGIVALFTLGTVFDNGIRSFKLTLGKDGGSAEVEEKD